MIMPHNENFSDSSLTDSKSPKLGVIMLDTTFPRIKGDIGNPETFSFPVFYQVVRGANPERIVLNPDRTLIQPFIDAGFKLIEQGANFLTTSCGFLALFHEELTQALPVPIYSSSLLQVHSALEIIRPEQKIGIITAHKPSLSRNHLKGVGIDTCPIEIIGMEHCNEFSSVFIGGKPSLDEDKCRNEMIMVTRQLMKSYPDIGAIVLECTNMPPYTSAIQKIANVPVFDVVTLMNTVHSKLCESQI